MIGQEELPVVELVQAFEEWRREVKRMVDKKHSPLPYHNTGATCPPDQNAAHCTLRHHDHDTGSSTHFTF